jgi:hypothetical protein
MLYCLRFAGIESGAVAAMVSDATTSSDGSHSSYQWSNVGTMRRHPVLNVSNTVKGGSWVHQDLRGVDIAAVCDAAGVAVENVLTVETQVVAGVRYRLQLRDSCVHVAQDLQGRHKKLHMLEGACA